MRDWLKKTERRYDVNWTADEVRPKGVRFAEQQELEEYRRRFGSTSEGET